MHKMDGNMPWAELACHAQNTPGYKDAGGNISKHTRPGRVFLRADGIVTSGTRQIELYVTEKMA